MERADGEIYSSREGFGSKGWLIGMDQSTDSRMEVKVCVRKGVFELSIVGR